MRYLSGVRDGFTGFHRGLWFQDSCSRSFRVYGGFEAHQVDMLGDFGLSSVRLYRVWGLGFIGLLSRWAKGRVEGVYESIGGVSSS